MSTPRSPHTIMALDLGTTGSRALLFDHSGQVVAQAYREVTQIYPQPGWLEHDPLQIWHDAVWAMQTVLREAQIEASQVAAIGLTVQRETCLLWDPATGQPLYNAIVWQDRRTAARCQEWVEAGWEPDSTERTGLVLDPYFSASKWAWLRDRLAAEQPHLDQASILAGTIDTWILWNLTGRRVHATDDSNASRTLLYNLATRHWDPVLLERFGIPAQWLPGIQPSLSLFGYTDPDLLGARIPITAVLGDQQAALFAHGCDRPGLMKCTYGTGCFLMAHTGSGGVRSRHRLLSTVAWSGLRPGTLLGYALEGSMFTAGSAIQWLRDGLRVISTAQETEAMAQQVTDTNGVYFVPALSGLGAPHWDMQARGAFLGITGGATRAHLVRAVLEAIAYQVQEVVQVITADMGMAPEALKVDGGACRNDFLMQLQADLLGIRVERPAVLDATAQGAAFAAGLAVGFWDNYAALVNQRPPERVFVPGEGQNRAHHHFATWQKAVERAKQWAEEGDAK